MNHQEQRALDRTVQKALNKPEVVQTPEQYNVNIDLLKLCELGVLKPKQIFDHLKKQLGDQFPFEWQEEESKTPGWFPLLSEVGLASILERQVSAVNALLYAMNTPMSEEEVRATIAQAMANPTFDQPPDNSHLQQALGVSAESAHLFRQLYDNAKPEKEENECSYAPNTPSS